MSTFGINGASLPGNSKFSIQRLDWKNDGFVPIGEPFTSEATVSENYNITADTVKYPIQDNFPLTDMSRSTSETVVISALNTNSFMSALAIVPALTNSAAGSFFGVSETQKAYNLLSEYARLGRPVLLKTIYAKEGYKSLGKITPFILSNLSILRNKDTGDSIGYTAMFQRVFISEIARTYRSDIILKGKLSPTEPPPAQIKNQGPILDTQEEAVNHHNPESGDGIWGFFESVFKAVGF